MPDSTGALGGIPRAQTGHAGGLPSVVPPTNGIAIQSKKGPLLDVREQGGRLASESVGRIGSEYAEKALVE